MEQLDMFEELKSKIYESPDRGETIYERDFGSDPSSRRVVKTSVQQQWEIKNMEAVVWSKTNCPYCVNAKKLLEQKGYKIEERIIGDGYTKEQLLEAVPNARTVPQIFLDGSYIGGFDNLQEHFKTKL
jgi:glutaredoxin 3